MKILSTKGWDSYRLVDSGEGNRLEKWGGYYLVRPDPQAIWAPRSKPLSKLLRLEANQHQGLNSFQPREIMKQRDEQEVEIDAVFEKFDKKEGWIKKNHIPNEWIISYRNLFLKVKLTPFKHTGIFPEQSIHWEWMRKIIEKATFQPNILNLFAYTGVASLIAAESNAKVTHVDASRPSIGWAKENQLLSRLENKSIRYILDDAIKFAERELRRGKKYNGIIMDPPVYGHGPNGEKWDFQKSFPYLLSLCQKLLKDNPLFIIINAYAISSSSLTLKNLMDDIFKDKGIIEVGELALEEDLGRLLSTGIFARWKNS